MGFFDFLKSKKKKEAGDKAEDEVLALEVDPADIDPPETRYTEEYREFLEKREAAERKSAPQAEELPAEEPCAAEEAAEFAAEEEEEFPAD